MILLLPVGFSPAKIILICRTSVKMVLNDHCIMSDYYCCIVKFSKTSADTFHKFSLTCHISMSFSVSLFERVLSAIFFFGRRDLFNVFTPYSINK